MSTKSLPRLVTRMAAQNSGGVREKAAMLPELRSPLAKLLHGLNQPLTGLQCSTEVALASPRSCEQYEEGLRQGLELTERMRVLVQAIHEVANVEEENQAALENIELKNILREAIADLVPVAEVQGIRIDFDYGTASQLPITMRADRQEITAAIFRLLESATSLAEGGSTLRVEAEGSGENALIRVAWIGRPAPEFSRPELSLLVSQAGWECAGAQWRRERVENLETVTIRLPHRNPA
jgi:signal transduction histidine kinase